MRLTSVWGPVGAACRGANVQGGRALLKHESFGTVGITCHLRELFESFCRSCVLLPWSTMCPDDGERLQPETAGQALPPSPPRTASGLSLLP